MPREYEVAALKRIMSINWRMTDPTRPNSQLALFNEYLRRTGIWAIALDWEDAHPIVSDFPSQIYSGLKAAPVNTTLMQQSLRTLGRTNVYERMLLTRALNWAALEEMGILEPYNLPDIYEPLLMFYERRGWLEKVLGSGDWDVSGRKGAIDRAYMYSDLDPIELDDVLLDQLDSAQQA